MSGDGQPPEELTTTFATSNLFKVLGIEPIIGSHWPVTLDKKGSHTVMLTHEFWKRRYGGRENVEGIDITLDGFAYQNYGVLPEGFSFPGRNEAFRALAFADFVIDTRDYRSAIGLARLKSGISLTDINKELEEYAKVLQGRQLKTNSGVSFTAEPLSDLFIGEIKGYLILLGAAILFLLIIAAVNISNLVISQALRQGRETVLRKVLGSSNRLIIQDFVVKSLVLSLAGSLMGLVFGWFLLNASSALVEDYLPYWINISLNYRLLISALIIAIFFGIITGLAPWLFHFAGGKLISRLQDGPTDCG